MTTDQAIIIGILGLTLVLFVWNRFRHDIVAFLALMAATVAGLIPVDEIFSGFGHPATMTVAFVLILSRGLQNAGVVDIITKYLMPPLARTEAHIGVVSTVAGTLSAVMNNVGALALLMPATIASAAKVKRPVALLLMPLSFGSILGGLVTLIGTPPNIIVAAIRGETVGAPFTMFDFTPVGAAIAIGGIVFIAAIGWRLIPTARRAALSAGEAIAIENYVSEARIQRGSKAIGKTLAELDEVAEKEEAVLLEVLRRGRRLSLTGRDLELRSGDVLLIEAGPEAIEKTLKALDLAPTSRRKKSGLLLGGPDIAVLQTVIQAGSALIGQTRDTATIRRRFGVNILAISREGTPIRNRLRNFPFRAGDVLLLEGDAEILPEAAVAYDCLPLASPSVTLGRIERAGLAILIFGAAIMSAAFGWIALPLAFALAALAMVLVNIVPLRDLYDSIDWPVIVLIGAMIPVGNALQSTETTGLAANLLLSLARDQSPVVLLIVLMVVTMTLSDVINNAATAVVMAPIGVAIAQGLGVNPDTYLMGVAIAASCAFLTPIGHQNNTLIMGPGGYHFGDYWRLGVPLELIVLAIAVPLLLVVWPL
ncbi:MAG: SLC13 family permease [Alphaproteobacteria bacterium]